MPSRPTLHRPYRQRQRKSWDKGAVKQDRLTGRALQKRNKRIQVRDRFTCQNKRCGLISSEMEVDHRVPVAAGGSDDDSNCRCLCHMCHSIKSRIESKGKLLPNPDNFPLTYQEARRSVEYERRRCIGLVDDDGDGDCHGA